MCASNPIVLVGQSDRTKVRRRAGVLPAGGALLLALAAAGGAWADVRIDVHERSWSAGPTPSAVESIIRTWVRGPARRIENQLLGAASDSAARAASFAQIDRLDRDSSYFVRPAEEAFFLVGHAGSRVQNRERARQFAAARAAGTAPADTLPPVTVTDLGRSRKIAGVACRGFVVDLRFAYQDSALGPGHQLEGTLSDTVWLAPPDSPAAELGRFERDLAAATAADTMLAAGNAVQLSQARGLGLVAVLERARRGLPGQVLSSHFVNLLRGLPRGLSGVERLPDGTAVVQRTVREAIAVTADPLPDALFEPPPGFRRAERGARAGPGGEKAPRTP